MILTQDPMRLVRAVPAEIIDKGDNSVNQVPADRMGVPFTNQLSMYNSLGARYAAHRDAGDETGYFLRCLQYFIRAGIQEREYTVILYLNDGKWSDGRALTDSPYDGCLRCYMGASGDDDIGTSASDVLNIQPDGGRLVIFDSKKILHEVMPTSRERVAITCWAGGSHSKFLFLRPLCIPI